MFRIWARRLQVIVTTVGNGTVTLMKWDDTSCVNITDSITVHNCKNCTLNVTSSDPAGSCYLQLTFPEVASTFQATHTVALTCGAVDTDWFLTQVDTYQPNATGHILYLTSYRGSVIFTHYCTAATAALADQLCTELLNNAELQAFFANPGLDDDSDGSLLLLLLLLLLPLGLGALALFMWWGRKRTPTVAMMHYHPQSPYMASPYPTVYPQYTVATPAPSPHMYFGPPPVMI